MFDPRLSFIFFLLALCLVKPSIPTLLAAILMLASLISVQAPFNSRSSLPIVFSRWSTVGQEWRSTKVQRF